MQFGGDMGLLEQTVCACFTIWWGCWCLSSVGVNWIYVFFKERNKYK